MSIPNWSIVIPYFNEEDCLHDCFECIVKQTTRPHRIILVNNASSDRSDDIVFQFRQKYHALFDIIVIDELNRGKTNALIAGIKHVNTRYFATWDADTFYPDDYLEQAEKPFKAGKGKTAAAMATDLYADPDSLKGRVRMIKIQLRSRLRSSECHAGGHSETFDTTLFRKAGSFNPERWPYVLEDHEIVQCLRQVGRIVYPWGLWCKPSRRRTNRSRVTWTKWEKRVYGFSPGFMKNWVLYHFLGPRFKARGLFNDRLREQPWKKEPL